MTIVRTSGKNTRRKSFEKENVRKEKGKSPVESQERDGFTILKTI